MVSLIGRSILLGQVLLGILVTGGLISGYGLAPLAALAWGLLVAVGLHALIVVVEFLLAGYASSETPLPDQLGLMGWAQCVGGEIAASLMTFSIRQPFFGATALASAFDQSPKTPIVFIHGFFCNRAIWRPAATWLASVGHPIHSVNLEPVYGSIDEYPALIDRAVKDLQSRCGYRPVALVCHSMGGLAARAYLRDFGNSAIARVITLGTPHQGTFLANFSHAGNSKQMRLQSPWRDALASSEADAIKLSSEPNNRQQDSSPDTPPTGVQGQSLFTVVFSHHDNIVAPQSIQTFDGAKVISTAGKGHVRLAVDPEIWQIIADELELAAISE